MSFPTSHFPFYTSFGNFLEVERSPTPISSNSSHPHAIESFYISFVFLCQSSSALVVHRRLVTQPSSSTSRIWFFSKLWNSCKFSVFFLRLSSHSLCLCPNQLFHLCFYLICIVNGVVILFRYGIAYALHTGFTV